MRGVLIGSLFKIKPIVYFAEDGKVKPYDKVRTKSRVIKLWESLIEEALDKFNGKLKLPLLTVTFLKKQSSLRKDLKICIRRYLPCRLFNTGTWRARRCRLSRLGIIPYIS